MNVHGREITKTINIVRIYIIFMHKQKFQIFFLSKCWDKFISNQNFSKTSIFGFHISSIISESKVRVLFLMHILLEDVWLGKGIDILLRYN